MVVVLLTMVPVFTQDVQVMVVAQLAFMVQLQVALQAQLELQILVVVAAVEQ